MFVANRIGDPRNRVSQKYESIGRALRTVVSSFGSLQFKSRMTQPQSMKSFEPEMKLCDLKMGDATSSMVHFGVNARVALQNMARMRQLPTIIAVLCTYSLPLEAHTTSASLASFSPSRMDAHGVAGLRTCASVDSLGTEKRGRIGRGWAGAERPESKGGSLMRLRGGGLLAASITCVPLPAPFPSAEV